MFPESSFFLWLLDVLALRSQDTSFRCGYVPSILKKECGNRALDTESLSFILRRVQGAETFGAFSVLPAFVSSSPCAGPPRLRKQRSGDELMRIWRTKSLM